MGPFRSLCVLIDSNWSGGLESSFCVFMDFDGSLCVFMGPCSFLRILMGPFGY